MDYYYTKHFSTWYQRLDLKFITSHLWADPANRQPTLQALAVGPDTSPIWDSKYKCLS